MMTTLSKELQWRIVRASDSKEVMRCPADFDVEQATLAAEGLSATTGTGDLLVQSRMGEGAWVPQRRVPGTTIPPTPTSPPGFLATKVPLGGDLPELIPGSAAEDHFRIPSGPEGFGIKYGNHFPPRPEITVTDLRRLQERYPQVQSSLRRLASTARGMTLLRNAVLYTTQVDCQPGWDWFVYPHNTLQIREEPHPRTLTPFVSLLPEVLWTAVADAAPEEIEYPELIPGVCTTTIDVIGNAVDPEWSEA